MVLHVYHCNRILARDKRRAIGRNRPGSIVRDPPRPGGADIDYLPPVDGLGDPQLAALLEIFREVELDAPDSPVKVDWLQLEQRMGLPREEIRALLEEASSRGLLRSLANAYDHERWMAASSNKGCLLVMACVEQDDLTRESNEIRGAFCRAIVSLRDGIVGEGDVLDTAFVMPNVHLGPRLTLATDSSAIVSLLRTMTEALGEFGFDVRMNSFGYSKMLEFAINAHPLGYVLRVE